MYFPQIIYDSTILILVTNHELAQDLLFCL
jgi:hypothetical protein